MAVAAPTRDLEIMLQMLDLFIQADFFDTI